MTNAVKANYHSAQTTGRYKNEKSRRKTVRLVSWQMANRFIAVILICLGVCYIITINDLAVKGMVLEEMKNNASLLNDEKSNHEVAVMRMQSYDNIDKRAREMSMVKVDKIEYITLGNTDVAKR